MQNTSVQSQIFGAEVLQELTLLLSDRLARISHWQENEKDLKGIEVALSGKQSALFLTSDQVYLSGKMLKERFPQMVAQTFGRLSNALPTLGVIDLNGNCLTQSGFYPKIESGFTLSDILQPQSEVSEAYFLSEKMVKHILKVKPGQNQKPNFLRQLPQEKDKERKIISSSAQCEEETPKIL